MVSEKKIFQSFPILRLWELYVAITISYPIQSAQKPHAALPTA